jgi:hypothetical protein
VTDDVIDQAQPDADLPAEHQPAWLAEAEQSDHYLRLEDAVIVGTEALLSCQDNLYDVIEAQAMACFHGSAGFGKSLSVNATLRELAPDNTLRVVFRSRPTTRDIRHALFHALHLPGDPPGRPIEFDTLLKEALARKFRVLVCDEAQWMSRECFEYWRHLWDDPDTKMSVLFVGGGDCYKVLRREPMLASRIYLWQKFQRMESEEVARVIPAFHPVWSDVDSSLIDYADTHAGHGNFRNWARMTQHILQGVRRKQDGVVDKALIEWVFSRVGKQ